MHPLVFCDFSGAQYLIFGSGVAPLVYYSHLPTMIISLLLGIYILSRDWRALPNQILFVITCTFSSWVFLDAMFWATNRSDVVMATWAGTVLIEPLVHVAGLYLLYVLVEKKDLPFWAKCGFFVLYLPLIIFAPTSYNLGSFDLTTCLANEAFIARYYSYGLEIFAMILVLCYAVDRVFRATSWGKRREILILSAGTFLLMFAFSWGNIIGSFTDDWQIGQFGLFGMPIFIAFFMYAIVTYRVFNAKLIGAVALVLTLCALTFGLIFVNSISVFQYVAATTFFLALIFGIMLIRSVQAEVRAREEVERLSEEKSEFMSFASHEIRNPITAMRGYASFIVDGTAGQVGQQAQEIAQKILVNGDTVLSLISEFLNKSKVELGQISYTVADIDVGKTIESISEGFKAHAREKGLTLNIKIDFPNLIAKADDAKLREVVGNLIDNSVKYTKAGSVTVNVEKRNGMARITISDTGVGIPPETISHLFQKFSRADAAKMNLLGTGLGLYLAKNFIEGMGGKIWAESDGKDKGSRFIIELHTV